MEKQVSKLPVPNLEFTSKQNKTTLKHTKIAACCEHTEGVFFSVWG
jgi:hypothetical protein